MPAFAAICRSNRVLVVIALIVSAVPLSAHAYVPHHPGRWTQPMTMEDIAIHVVLLRGDMGPIRSAHSRVLWFGGSTGHHQKQGLWDWRLDIDRAPFALGQNIRERTLPQPPFDIFCSGHSLLGGNAFITGGHEGNNIGLVNTAIFDRTTLSYVERASMSQRRWYPTNVQLAKANEVLVVSGSEFNRMVVFGGHNIPTGTLRNSVDPYRLTVTGAWEASQSSNPEPSRREGHSLALNLSGASFVFGGDSAGVEANDVWKLDEPEAVTQDYFWSKLTINNPDDMLPRKWASAIARGDTIYVFGGLDTTSTTRGDLQRLRFNSLLDAYQWLVPFTSPVTPPSARHGHTMVYSPSNGRAYLFGGKQQNGSLSDELWSLRFGGDSAHWQRITKMGGPLSRPRSRWLHAMAADGLTHKHNGTSGWSRMFVFGGDTTACSGELWEMWIPPTATDSVQWVKLNPSNPPSARRQASLAFNIDEKQLLLYGGETDCSGSTGDATVWSLRLGTGGALAWQAIASNSVAPRGHVAFYDARPVIARIPELYDAVTNQFTAKTSAELTIPYYPHLFSDTTGSYIFYATPRGSRRLTLSAYQWEFWPVGLATHTGGSAVRFRPARVMKSGVAQSGVNTEWMALEGTALGSRWRRSSNNMLDRTHHNLTVMPGGEVIVTGGEQTIGTTIQYVKRPEIWNPDALVDTTYGEWYGAQGTDTLNASAIQRDYHSTAILLPDGRVLCTGGNADSVQYETADLYSPPYLFTGVGDTAAARPRLDGVQETIVYGQTFSLRCKDPIVQAVLVRPGAVTHAFNQDQRWIPLTPTGSSDTPCRQFVAPADSNIAPHGDYLLFVLNGAKVPSMGHWVRLGNVAGPSYSTCDSLRPQAVSSLSRVCLESSNSVRLRWRSPYEDSTGISNETTLYELRYRDGAPINSMAAFIDSAISVSGMPTPRPVNQWDSVTVSGLTAGHTYYFRLISRDDAAIHRNWSDLSNTVTIAFDGEQQCGGSGGGCCQEEGGGLRGPIVASATSEAMTAFENSVWVGATTEGPASDLLRLEGDPHGADGLVRAWLTEQEHSTITGVRLLAVDAADGREVLASNSGPVSGLTASTVITAAASVQALLDSDYVGHPTDTLLAALPEGATHLVIESRGGVGGIQLSGSSGAPIVYHPRLEFERRVFGPFNSPVRITFVGDHELRSIQAFEVDATPPIVHALQLFRLEHSGSESISELPVGLSSGERLDLAFDEAEPLVTGARTYFLEVTGGPSESSTAIESMKSRTAVPGEWRLAGSRPNPFREATAVAFSVPMSEHVRIEIFDLSGRRVRTLVNERVETGYHEVEWNRRDGSGRRVAPGLYFYRMRTGSFRAERRLVVLP